MASIIRIRSAASSNEEIAVEPFWSSYFFANILRFLVKHGLFDQDKTELKIAGDLREKLAVELDDALRQLLEVSYTEPSPKELQKYSSRFERIEMDAKIYKINYRMSAIGRLAVALYSISNLVKGAVSKGEDVHIELDLADMR